MFGFTPRWSRGQMNAFWLWTDSLRSTQGDQCKMFCRQSLTARRWRWPFHGLCCFSLISFIEFVGFFWNETKQQHTSFNKTMKKKKEMSTLQEVCAPQIPLVIQAGTWNTCVARVSMFKFFHLDIVAQAKKKQLVNESKSSHRGGWTAF